MVSSFIRTTCTLSALSEACLGKKHNTELDHPPFSPDLGPCCFFLFPKKYTQRKPFLAYSRSEEENSGASETTITYTIPIALLWSVEDQNETVCSCTRGIYWRSKEVKCNILNLNWTAAFASLFNSQMS